MFAVQPGSKEPMPGSHGWHDATTDLQEVARCWTDYPSANIGIATRPSNLLVLDFDWRNGGDLAWDAWGKDLVTARVKTPNGYHLYFRRPAQHEDFHRVVEAGVDVNTKGYVLAPPSIHPSGQPYRWEVEAEPAELPQWLVDRCVRPRLAPREVVGDGFGGTDGDADDTRPGSVYGRSVRWADVLGPHGWEFAYSDGECEYWRRPGKLSGISASTNYADCGLLYPFTTSTDFEADRAYTKFAAYAVLNHGGDFSAAASALAATQRNPTALFNTPYSLPSEEPLPEPPVLTPADNFIGRYMRYAELQTDAPTGYHEAAALTLLAAVTPGARAYLAPFPGGLRTNLNVILVGQTTRSRKSTAQRIASSLLGKVSPFSRLPDRETPEAFIQTLSQRPGVGTLWTPDELGISIAEMYRRDFMSTLESLLLTLYAGDDFSYHRASDTIQIRSPHLNILGAATPDSLARAGASALESGLLPRFAIVFPRTLPESRPAAELSTEVDGLRRGLETELHAIKSYAGSIDRVSFTAPALALLNASEGTLVGHGDHAARLPAMLYKVGMLTALSACRNEVTEADAQAACAVVERWADGVNYLRSVLFRKAADVEFEALAQHALGVVERAGGRVRRAAVAQELLVSKTALDRIEATLQDRAQLRVIIENGERLWSTI